MHAVYTGNVGQLGVWVEGLFIRRTLLLILMRHFRCLRTGSELTASLGLIYSEVEGGRRPRSWRELVIETRKRMLGEEHPRLAHEHG